MSLTEARRLAVDNVMKIRARFPRKSGIDRLLESADSAAPLALTGPTFRELASDYIEFKRRDGWKHGSKTKKITRSHLSNYAYPVIGKIQIEQVTHVHVSEVLAPIWNTKPPTAKKVKQTLSLAILAVPAVQDGVCREPREHWASGPAKRRWGRPGRQRGPPAALGIPPA